MPRQNLFDEAIMDGIRERIRRLTADTEPAWGKMDCAQMLAHCSEVLDIANGKPLIGTPFYMRLIGPLIRRSVLSERPYPRNLPTHQQYVVADPEDFAESRDRLLQGLTDLLAGDGPPARHPLFGTMSKDDTGWAQYKHIDHHLIQFGV